MRISPPLFNLAVASKSCRHGHLVRELQVGAIRGKLRVFAECIRMRGSPLPYCWGFVDGTIRPIARPIAGQRMVFNGKDRVHALKYQSITTPDGILRSLCGAYNGTMHDARMMEESGIEAVLRENMTLDGQIYCIYGDPAYRRSPFLLTPWAGNLMPDSPEAVFNKRMASVRISVEWGFGKLNNLWGAEKYTSSHKLYHSKCGLEDQYITMGILTNIHTCMHGCQTSKYFNLAPPSVFDYISGRG